MLQITRAPRIFPTANSKWNAAHFLPLCSIPCACPLKNHPATTNWPVHKYNVEEREDIEGGITRPSPTNYIRVPGDVSKLTLNETARLAAQLAGKNIEHKFKVNGEEKTVCLASVVSAIGCEMNMAGMKTIENDHHIPSFQGGHPVCNKNDVRLVSGARMLNYYKNDFCGMTRIQEEIQYWKDVGGMKVGDIESVLDQFTQRDLELCDSVDEEEQVKDSHKEYLDRIKRILGGSGGEGRTGIVILGLEDRKGKETSFWIGGSGGSEETSGATRGADFELTETKNLASVDLSTPQALSKGNNVILHELFGTGAIAELWCPKYSKFDQFSLGSCKNLKEVNKKWCEQTGNDTTGCTRINNMRFAIGGGTSRL